MVMVMRACPPRFDAVEPEREADGRDMVLRRRAGSAAGRSDRHRPAPRRSPRDADLEDEAGIIIERTAEGGAIGDRRRDRRRHWQAPRPARRSATAPRPSVRPAASAKPASAAEASDSGTLERQEFAQHAAVPRHRAAVSASASFSFRRRAISGGRAAGIGGIAGRLHGARRYGRPAPPRRRVDSSAGDLGIEARHRLAALPSRRSSASSWAGLPKAWISRFCQPAGRPSALTTASNTAWSPSVTDSALAGQQAPRGCRRHRRWRGHRRWHMPVSPRSSMPAW